MAAQVLRISNRQFQGDPMHVAAARALEQRLWQRALRIRWADLPFRSRQLQGADADVHAGQVALHRPARVEHVNLPVLRTANRGANNLLQSGAS